MHFYFAHNGIDDGHPNETGPVLGTNSTIDTAVPGPQEPKAHPNYVLIASVGLIVVVILAAGGAQLKKKLAAKKSSAATPANSDPVVPAGETLATIEMKTKASAEPKDS